MMDILLIRRNKIAKVVSNDSMTLLRLFSLEVKPIRVNICLDRINIPESLDK